MNRGPHARNERVNLTKLQEQWIWQSMLEDVFPEEHRRPLLVTLYGAPAKKIVVMSSADYIQQRCVVKYAHDDGVLRARKLYFKYAG
eukprot:1968997-Amphidinium_carterae.1